MRQGRLGAAFVAGAVAALAASRWNPVGAAAWTPPSPLPTLRKNEVLLEHAEKVLKGRVLGPESLAKDPRSEWVYSGTMDGRIVRFKADDPDGTLETFVWLNASCAELPQVFEYDEYDPALEPLCGRPLGLKFDPARPDKLYVLESYTGLLELDLASRHLTVLYDGAKLANDLDVDGDLVFFSETSPRWGRNKIILELLAARPTGKLLVFDRASGAAPRVLVDGVLPTNGVCLSHDRRMVYFVAGPAIHAYDRDAGAYAGIAADNLPCIPDNLRRHPSDGRTYLLACGGRRQQPFSLADALAPYPMARELLLALVGYSPRAILKFIPVHSMVLRLEVPGGAVVASAQDPSGAQGFLSEAERVGDFLLVGTWKDNWLTRVRWDKAGLDGP